MNIDCRYKHLAEAAEDEQLGALMSNLERKDEMAAKMDSITVRAPPCVSRNHSAPLSFQGMCSPRPAGALHPMHAAPCQRACHCRCGHQWLL